MKPMTPRVWDMCIIRDVSEMRYDSSMYETWKSWLLWLLRYGSWLLDMKPWRMTPQVWVMTHQMWDIWLSATIALESNGSGESYDMKHMRDVYEIYVIYLSGDMTHQIHRNKWVYEQRNMKHMSIVIRQDSSSDKTHMRHDSFILPLSYWRCQTVKYAFVLHTNAYTGLSYTQTRIWLSLCICCQIRICVRACRRAEEVNCPLQSNPSTSCLHTQWRSCQ